MLSSCSKRRICHRLCIRRFTEQKPPADTNLVHKKSHIHLTKMGKRKRSDKRINALGEELAGGFEEIAKLSALKKRDDSSLFMLDTLGGGRSGRGSKHLRPVSQVVPDAVAALSNQAAIADAMAVVSRVRYLRPNDDDIPPPPPPTRQRDKQPPPPAPKAAPPPP